MNMLLFNRASRIKRAFPYGGPIRFGFQSRSRSTLTDLRLPNKVGIHRYEDRRQEDIAGLSFLRHQWKKAPRTALLVSRQKEATNLLNQDFINGMAAWLYANYPDFNVVVDQQIAENFPGLPCFDEDLDSKEELYRTIDLVIAVGGGNAVLRASALFQGEAPPIISFHTQAERRGFLSPFSSKDYKAALERAIAGNFSLTERCRLDCRVLDVDEKLKDSFVLLNELVLHRAATFNLLSVDTFAYKDYMTTFVGDGIIVSTPTGSTAYSLSCGGSMIHPSIRTIALASICPFSMSSRAALLPGTVRVCLKLSSHTQKNLENSVKQPILTMDGHFRLSYGPEDIIEVSESQFPLYTINDETETRDWINDLNKTIKWNNLLHPAFSSYSTEERDT